MENKHINLDDDTEKVIRYYSDMVYRLAFARVGNRQDAEDIFQEVFLRYVKTMPLFNDEEHRKAWLIRVTVNCSNNLWKTLQRRNSGQIYEEVVFEEKEIYDLYNELEKLPRKYRQIIHLFYYEDMSVEDISQTLKIKKSTVRTQLTRARRMLKDFMQEEDYV